MARSNLAETIVADNVGSSLRATARAAAEWLIARQRPDGHWVGRAESNACMEAQWCLALWFVGLEAHPLRPRLARSLIETQRADGSWQIYHDAPAGDINATVEAYAALRSMGHAEDEAAMVRARDWILSKGGLRNVRVFTRYWLALLGEWPWDKLRTCHRRLSGFRCGFPSTSITSRNGREPP